MDVAAQYLEKPWLRFYPESVPATVEVPNVSLCDVFDQATEAYANHTAIVFYGNAIKFRELRDKVDRFAAALADLGVTPGDKVALYLLNSPQFVIAYFGALKAGATVTPISPVYTSVEVRHQLRESGARIIVCQDILHDNVERSGAELDTVIVTGIDEFLTPMAKLMAKGMLSRATRGRTAPTAAQLGGSTVAFKRLLEKYPPQPPAVTINPREDLATLPFTGGTTGQPKGTMLTHYNILACQAQVEAAYPNLEMGKETSLAFLPFYHIYGQVVLMIGGLLTGTTMVLFTTPDMDQILFGLEKYRATSFFGVPTLYEFLKEHEKTSRVNWKRLKLVVCGADTLHETTVRDWERRTGVSISEGYGMTETSGVSHTSPIGRPKVGSFGVPLPNVTAAVVDPEGEAFLPIGEVGELVIHGPNIMQGYWNAPEETKKALVEIAGRTWLRTGDLVRMDEEGYFYYYDRKKDLIKYKGFSVFPREIEESLKEHPQVKAVGVIGVPDQTAGHLIKAHVVLHPEARGKVSEEDILAYCRERLAHYKVPKIIEFRGELPKTDVGKVSRRELREETAS